MELNRFKIILSSLALLSGSFPKDSGAQSSPPYVFSGGLSIAPTTPSTYSSPAAGQGPGFIETESYTGSPSNGSYFGDLSGSSIPLNLLNINSDTLNWQPVDASGNPTAGGVNGLEISHVYGGMSASGTQSTGSRASLLVSSKLNGSMPAASNGNFYAAGQFSAAANAVLSNPPSNQGWGDLYGLGVQSRTLPGATNWSSLFGMEIDMAAEQGSTTAFKVGLKVTSTGTDVCCATKYDAAIALAANNVNKGGWTNGVSFGDGQGSFPIRSSGTMIGAIQNPGNNPAAQAALGVDFSQVAFSTAAFRSPGFLIDGSGYVHSDLLTGASSPTVSIANDSTHDGLVVTPSSSGNGTGSTTLSAAGSDANVGITIASKSAAANKGDVNFKIGSYNALNLTGDGASLGNYLSLHATGGGASPYIGATTSGTTVGMGFRVQGNSNFDFATNQAVEYLQIGGVSSPTSYLRLTPGNGATSPQISTGGSPANLILGSGNPLGTAATSGFTLIPTVAGLPTSTVGAAGQAAFIVDTADSKLCANWGAGWKCATLQ